MHRETCAWGHMERMYNTDLLKPWKAFKTLELLTMWGGGRKQRGENPTQVQGHDSVQIDNAGSVWKDLSQPETEEHSFTHSANPRLQLVLSWLECYACAAL